VGGGSNQGKGAKEGTEGTHVSRATGIGGTHVVCGACWKETESCNTKRHNLIALSENKFH
jgi:hypothetical protein